MPQQCFQPICKTDIASALFLAISKYFLVQIAENSLQITEKNLNFALELYYLRFSFSVAEGTSITPEVILILY